jgi:hypothetical protein
MTSAKRARAKRGERTTGVDVPEDLGETEDPGGGVTVRWTDGALSFEPVAVRNMTREQREHFRQVAELVEDLATGQRQLRNEIAHARNDLGMSWGQLAFALRTTPEAARQRFGGTFGG